MVVAITGGTGFIGRKLLAHLVERGDTVRLLSRSATLPAKSSQVRVCECDLIKASVGDLSIMLDDVDVVYHCAGQLTNAHAMRSLHVDATRKLVEAASHRISHWVQLSSVGVYGPMATGSITEHSALNPVGQYEITKAESDQIVIDAEKKGGFTYSILRPSNVFGTDMTNQSLFGMIAMIDRGLFFYIGKPGASANYIHVNNVVEGLICCGTLQHARGGIYNLSDHCTLEHFVELIATELGRTTPWLRIPKPIAQLAGSTLGKMPGFPLTQSRVGAMVNRSIYPISRIRQELDYNHVTSMEDGLRELVEVYKRRLRHPVLQ